MYNNYNPNSVPNVIPNQSTDVPVQNFPQYANAITQNYQTNTQPQATLPYAENLFKNNIGKKGTFYMSYSDSVEWRDRMFKGTLLESGRDYLLVKEDSSNSEVVLLTVYLNFAIFDENLSY